MKTTEMPMEWGDERVPPPDVFNDLEDQILEQLKKHRPHFVDVSLFFMKLDHLIVRLLKRKEHNED